ncbi:hypothetical protein OROGR_033079 [Orobanche gracilis]
MMAETEVCKVHTLDWADDFPPLGKGNTLEDGAGFQVPSVLESNKETKSWTGVVISAPTPFDVKVKMNSNVTVSSIIEVSNSFDVKNGVAKNIGSETKDVKDVADQTDGTENSKEILYMQENGGTGNCHGKDIARGSLEGYSHLHIRKKEHMIQHETLYLKQEKQLIREIEQLEHFREELLANFDSQDEIKQSFEQRNEAEERLRILREELDSLKGIVARAEAAAVEAGKQHDSENKKIKELQAKSRAANDARQAAYVQLQGLRKKLMIKNKHFFNYKDSASAANSYSFTGNKKGLYSLCMDQIEKLMELWNTNNEFRQDYVKCNESRAELKAQKEAEEKERLKRLKKNEKKKERRKEKRKAAAMDANNTNSRAHEEVDRIISTPTNINLVSEMPILELKQEATVQAVTSDDKLPKKTTEHKNEKVMNETPGLVMVRGSDVTDEVQEQADLTKKTNEMLRREEDEAKMREQPILEELAKAEVASEKNQQAEKAHMGAELIAQKEAEEREKVRLKRLKKKERRREKKKAAAMDANDTDSCATVPNTKSTVEVSKNALNKEFSLQKPHAPTRTTSIYPPSRNRNKINYRQWMWTGLISFVVYILFWLGNLDVF